MRLHHKSCASELVAKYLGLPFLKKEYAPHAGSAYSDLGLYPFHARLPVPPELAIVTLKRFWSGQLTTGQIRDICQREKVPLIILPKGTPPPEWQTFLNAGYILTTNDGANALYTAKEIDRRHD